MKVLSYNKIGSTISRELTNNALKALFIAILLIGFYIIIKSQIISIIILMKITLEIIYKPTLIQTAAMGSLTPANLNPLSRSAQESHSSQGEPSFL